MLIFFSPCAKIVLHQIIKENIYEKGIKNIFDT